MKIRLKHDSRSKRFKIANVFGQATAVELIDEYIIADTLPTFVQPVGDVECLAISVCAVAEQMTGIDYDHEDLFSRIPHNQFGAVPQDVFSAVLKSGLKRKDNGLYDIPFKSYYEAHTGDLDEFDSIRSSLYTLKHPIILYTKWYENWYADVLPIGQGASSGHAYCTINGWKLINGVSMLVIDAWTGSKKYMPRETVNTALKEWGCGTAVFLTLEQDINRKKTILETIKDLCINTILLLKQLLAIKKPNLNKQVIELTTTPPPVVPVVEVPVIEELKPMPPKRDLLSAFCTAISIYEGKEGDLNHRNNNPGNLRNKDGSFMKFKTWDAGMVALKDYVTRVAKGEHKAYPKNCTVLQMFQIYAPETDKNNPVRYANWVCMKVGDPLFLGYKIKNLII